LQAPVASQVLVPLHTRPVVSSALVTVILHVPVAPQFWHWGQLDCVQQTLSRQLPVAQSVPAPQLCPGFFLHAPVASQVLLPVQVSASSALVTATHVPPAPVQAWQVPQDWVQQWLSVQLPDAQSPATEQVWPVLFLHAPEASQVFVPEQVAPVVSSALITAMLHKPLAPQLWHCGQVDCAQHTLSRQVSPAWHSPVAAHAVPAAFTKLAVIDVAASAVTMHVVVLPLQAPDQPAKVDRASGVAVSVTDAPIAKLARHVFPQLIPAGDDVTSPPPAPVLATFNPSWRTSKTAVTDLAASTVTRQFPEPLQGPDHPVKVDVASAVGVNVTIVPSAKLAEQVPPHAMPAGEDATVPPPVPLFRTPKTAMIAASGPPSAAVSGPESIPLSAAVVGLRSNGASIPASGPGSALGSGFDSGLASAVGDDSYPASTPG